MKARILFALMLLGAAASEQAWAVYTLRFSTITNGAVTMTGNAIGLSKGATNAPGTNGSIGAFSTTNTALVDGTYPAGTTANWAQNSASAVLSMPAGSTVLYAELVWGGSYSYGGQNVSASLNTPVSFTTPAGTSSVTRDVATAATLGTAGVAGTCSSTVPCFYVRSANVTALVQAGGAGTYTVGGIPATEGTSENNSNSGGWTLIVVYGNAGLPARNLTVFVGAEVTNASISTAATVSGFCTAPTGPRSGRLLASAIEGDSNIAGDQMTFGPTAGTRVAVSGPNNPVNNFFASQINGDNGALNTTGTFGTRNHPVGSMLSGGRQSWDITNVDISATLVNSQTSAVAQGTSNQDQYVISSLAMEINVGSPSFPVAVKSVDKAVTFVGDTLTYTVTMNNTTGTANATNVVFTDTPPPGTAFVPNTLTLDGVVQAGANPAAGVNIGTIAAGGSRVVTFQVAVNSIPAAPATAQYSNSASWTYQYVSCVGQPTTNGSLTTNPVVTNVARLVPAKTVAPSGTAYPGQTLTYTINVPNTGTANTAGTTLQDSVPAGTTYVPGSTTLNGGAVPDIAGAMPFTSAATIASPGEPAGQVNAGETATVVFQVTVDAATATSITNTAVTDPDGAGPAPALNTAATSNVANLTPLKSVSPSGDVSPGEVLTYTIATTNSGNGNSSGTTLADPIPAGTTYVAGSTTLNGGAVADVAGAMPYATARTINSPGRPAGQVNAGETATVQFRVTVNAPGGSPVVNTATMDPDGAGSAPARVSQVSQNGVVPDLALTKSHTGAFLAGETGTYTLQAQNVGTGAVAVGPLTLTDTLPASLTVAQVPTGTNWDCSATVLLSNTATCTYTGAFPIAPAAALPSVTLDVNVSPSAPASVTNTATISTAFGETTTANNTATDPTSIIAKPTVTKSFTPTVIASGSTSTMTLVVTNSAAIALTGVTFTDSFPAGMVVAPVPNLASSCGGTLTGGGGGNTFLNLANGALAATTTCTITVDVTTSLSGTFDNGTSGVAANETGAAGSGSNIARLTVLTPPSLSKAFSPAAIGVNGVSTLTFTLTNLNSAAITGAAFADTYPANLVNALAPNVTNTCGGSTTGGASGGSTIGLTGATIPAAGSCTVSVRVTSASTGTYDNVSDAITSTNAGTGNAASATLTVTDPSIAKSFSPAIVPAGVFSTVTFVLSNGAVLPATAAAFTDNLPAGLVVATPAAPSSDCGGTLSAASGSSTISLSGGTIPALGSCTVTVRVVAASPGSYANTASGISSSLGNGSPSNTAILTVTTPATIVKSFTPATIRANELSTMGFQISNPNSVALTGVAFTDNFPGGGLQVAATPNLTSSCVGTITGASPGSTVFALSGGALAAGATCTITVVVTSPTPGTFSNTTTGVSSNETSVGTPANAVLLTTVAADLRLTKTHSGNFTVGTQGTYVLTVDNSAGTAATIGTVTVRDTLPAGLTYAAAGSGGTGWSCSAAGQVVTCTSSTVIDAGTPSPNPISINVSVGATAVPAVTNSARVSGGGEPAANTGNNDAFDPTVVVQPAVNTFAPDNAQTALPGTTVFYAHTFSAGLAGDVSFAATSTATPAIGGWSQRTFRDSDCNATLNGTEGDAALSGPVAVTAGSTVCVIVQEVVPATAPYGANDVVTVTASFAPASGPVAQYSRTDTTTVGTPGGAGLTLSKAVRNVTTGGATGTSNAARPGETLEYIVTYSNLGSEPLTNIVIADSTPAYTLFVSASCGAPLPANLTACAVTTQPAAGAAGAIVWTLTGTLASTGSGTVVFTVVLDL